MMNVSRMSVEEIRDILFNDGATWNELGPSGRYQIDNTLLLDMLSVGWWYRKDDDEQGPRSGMALSLYAKDSSVAEIQHPKALYQPLPRLHGSVFEGH